MVLTPKQVADTLLPAFQEQCQKLEEAIDRELLSADNPKGPVNIRVNEYSVRVRNTVAEKYRHAGWDVRFKRCEERGRPDFIIMILMCE